MCWALLGAILLFLGSSLIATLAGGISWLLLLNFCSYVKLGITLVKYMPQAFMNYRYRILHTELYTVYTRHRNFKFVHTVYSAFYYKHF